MDFNAFYREQDRRMNLPEGDIHEYLQRMKVVRETAKARCTTQLDLELTDASRTWNQSPQSEEKLEDVHASTFNEIEQHPLELPVNGASFPAASRKLNPSSADASGPTGADEKNQFHEHDHLIATGRAETPSLRDRNILAHSQTHSLQNHEVIRSVSFSPRDTPSELSPILNSPSVRSEKSKSRKRKASSDVVAEENTRKRSNQTKTPIEEINSFSTCPRMVRKSAEVRPISRQGTKGQMKVYERKIPALDLRPISTSGEILAAANPPTSPIEDDSLAITSPPKEPTHNLRNKQNNSSVLFLDIQERITQRLALKSKRRDNPAKRDKLAPDQSSIISISSSSRSSSPDLGLSKVIPSPTKVRQKAATKKKAIRKPRKEKFALMTPEDFANSLLETAVARGGGLSGTTIFYTGGDMQYASERTRGRMNLILRHGGRLVSRYDSDSVTHIVTDAQQRPTLRALGLRRPEEIPQHIPTVTWDWVAARMNQKPDIDACYDRLFMYTAFPERIEAGYKIDLKGKGKANAEEDISHISEFTVDNIRPQAARKGRTPTLVHDSESEDVDKPVFRRDHILPSPPTSPPGPKVSSSKHPISVKQEATEDPLTEFYSKARSRAESRSFTDESDVATSSGTELDESDNYAEPSKQRNAWKWTCDKQSPKDNCPNQDIINKLEDLKELHQAKVGEDDQWRVFTYNKCMRALKGHPKRISSFAEARSIRGIGDKTAAKIMEIIQTGDLRRIKYERTDDVQTTKLFQGIYGVGRVTAYQWYSAGCRTLADLTSGTFGVQLSPAQEIGIKFYDDINDRMPRDETRQLFELIKRIALKIDSNLFIEVMGSFRRGKPTCGDIDILITRNPADGQTHEGVLSRLLSDLHAVGILTEDLALPEDENSLENVYRGLCKLPNVAGARRRRIDFLTVPWQSRGAALLYYTGDDIFNRAMRMKANKMGYSLNQRGLFANVVRDPRDRRIKLNKGTLVASETEQEIFDILDVSWQDPHERVRG